MNTSPTAYPLTWPSSWPRTDLARRETSRRKSTLPNALKNLRSEINLLGGKNLILSSNATLGNERPADSGVVAYFIRDGENVAIPCDRWKTIAENVQAIAKTVEALRGIERWGAKHMVKAAFRGFAALPEKASTRSFYDVLGIPTGPLTMAALDTAFRTSAILCHPDHGGTDAQMAELNEAYDQALKTITPQS